jgi:hypothetical protein
MLADAKKGLVRRFYAEFRDLVEAEGSIGPGYLDHNNAQAGRDQKSFAGILRRFSRPLPISI